MSASAESTPAPPGRFGAFVQRRPITTFLIWALGLGWPLLAVPVFAGIEASPFLILLVLVALLAPALVITRATGGSGAVRALLARVLVWRFSATRWAVILLGVPVITIVVAALSGTLQTPDDGWVTEAGTCLFATLIFPMLVINLWEETAWAGFVQARLMARHGLLIGSLLTALPFAAIHIPLSFEGDPGWSEVAVNTGSVFLLAFFARYLVGAHLLDTGSLLAVAIQHASWNATQNIDGIDGDWQFILAVMLLTVLVGIARRLWHSDAHPTDPAAERAAANEWVPVRERDAAGAVRSDHRTPVDPRRL